MPLRLPEPGTFEHLLRPATVAVSSLVRHSRSPSTEPCWSKAARYRFDDALPGRSSQFGVCYGATTLETAFAESVLHENALFEGGRFIVPDADLQGRWEVRFAHPKKKRLNTTTPTRSAGRAPSTMPTRHGTVFATWRGSRTRASHMRCSSELALPRSRRSSSKRWNSTRCASGLAWLRSNDLRIPEPGVHQSRVILGRLQ